MAGHGRLPSIPWSRINDFLLRVCAAQNLEEFNALVCAHVSALIPHDFPILCIAPKREDLVGFGTTHPEELVDPGIRAIAGDPGTVADFNRHFRFHLPIPIGYFLARVVTDFRPFTATELVTDFIRPRKVERCLGSWFHHYTIVIPRCKPSRPFDDKDIAVSRIISAHLDNFYSILSLSSLSCRAKAHELPLPGLTPREQEIANLISERFSTPEIADRLFISRRTVEKHAERIFAKLGIRKKREMGERLLTFRPYSIST